MRILITGGTGFIGSRLLPKLKDMHEVVVLSRRKRKGVIRGDISKKEDIEKAMMDVDAVIHLAVESKHGAPWKKHYLTTVVGTKNILEAAKKFGVEKVVYISSIAVEAKTRTNYVRAKKLQKK